MLKKNMVTFKLPRNHAGQIIDGLECRRKAYEDTAKYLVNGSIPGPDFVCEEVKDSAEAIDIACLYGEIIRTLEKQRDDQEHKYQRLVDEILRRARETDFGCGPAEATTTINDLASTEDPGTAALTLVSAFHDKYDWIALMQAAIEMIDERS